MRFHAFTCEFWINKRARRQSMGHPVARRVEVSEQTWGNARIRNDESPTAREMRRAGLERLRSQNMGRSAYLRAQSMQQRGCSGGSGVGCRLLQISLVGTNNSGWCSESGLAIRDVKPQYASINDRLTEASLRPCQHGECRSTKQTFIWLEGNYSRVAKLGQEHGLNWALGLRSAALCGWWPFIN